jgi:putative toxin-antitoxin system antitoxin component (TIGR02293 family)
MDTPKQALPKKRVKGSQRARQAATPKGKRPVMVVPPAGFAQIMDATWARLMELTYQGVSSDVAVALAEKLDIPTSRFAPWLGLSRATLDRKVRDHGALDLVGSDRVVRFAQLWKQAIHLWGSELAARQWLTSPEQALGGKQPLEMAVTEIGSRQVEDLMGQSAHGIAT